MKVYLDINVASAISRRHQPELELKAIDQVLSEGRAGRLSVGTSRQSLREIERAPSKYREGLKTGLSGLTLAEDDHRLLGFNHQGDQYGGFITYPLITDIVDKQLYEGLRADGLTEDDAKHVMFAAHNGYQRFLTCDKGILNRRAAIQNRCSSIQIRRPSEFAAELNAKRDPPN